MLHTTDFKGISAKSCALLQRSLTFRSHMVLPRVPENPLILIPSRCESDWGNKHKNPTEQFQQSQSVEQNHVSRDTRDRDTCLTQVKVSTHRGTMGNQESTPRVEPISETTGKNLSAPKSHRCLGQHLHGGIHLLGAALSTSLSPLALFYQ